MNKCNLLRKRLAEPGIILSPGVYDCLSAKIAERTGFEVVITSGFGISGSVLGYPDYGLLTATEMLNAAGNISKSVDIPLIADIDTGYGNPINVVRTIKDVVCLGIAGVILEDQEWPKRCGHLDGKRIIAMEEHVEKIRAARFTSGESRLVIVARTDARAELGLAEAIRRGKAYYEAGADVIFIEAPQTKEELKEIPSALPDVPLLANMIEGGKTPCLSARELEELGFKMGVFALSGLFAATKAIEDCFRFLKENGTTSGFENRSSFKDYKEIINMKKYQKLEEKFITRKPSFK
ncbi:MAG: isocitrate lyase/PEP mutase family protein [Candidatus Brocadiales bacterium]|nr:isocitrate lyase/PEP mutase family protein [Candidatus Brocadiales bacterium]